MKDQLEHKVSNQLILNNYSLKFNKYRKSKKRYNRDVAKAFIQSCKDL